MRVKVKRVRRQRQPENIGSYCPQDLVLTGHWRFTLTDIITGAVRVFEYDNLIPTCGRAALATQLVSGSPTVVLANKVALGTNTTAPANADIKLGTETYRNSVASETSAFNVAYITGFFSAAECSGTYKEAGIFAGGTAAADSGTLISHVAINLTKSSTETLTVDWQITIS